MQSRMVRSFSTSSLERIRVMGCRRCVEAKSVRSSRLDQVRSIKLGSDVPGSNEYQGRRDPKKALALRKEKSSQWERATPQGGPPTRKEREYDERGYRDHNAERGVRRLPAYAAAQARRDHIAGRRPQLFRHQA